MKETKISGSNEVIYEFKTSSNLPVYMWQNNKKENVYMALVVKYGSLGTEFKCANNEYSVPTGIAHYLEHIKFHLRDVDASQLFTDMGCDSNAYTSSKETVFEVYANENIYDAVNLLLDFVYDDYISKEDFENERGIILEEANSRKDGPSYEFYNKLVKSYFIESNYRNPIIGTEKDINRISYDDIKLVYDFFYRPENMFLVITGNFDKDKMQETIKTNEEKRKFKPIGNVKIIEHKEPDKLLTNKFEVKSSKCKNTKARIWFKTSLKDFKGYTKNEVILALRILFLSKFGYSSDIYEHIMQNNLATDFYNSVFCFNDIIAVDFSFHSENVNKVKKIIIDSLKDLEINKEEFERIKHLNEAQFIMKFDNIYEVAASMISSIVDENKPDRDEMKIISSLTTKKINDIYKYFKKDNYIVGINKPDKDTKKEA